jgi:hypothetical protein
MISEFLARVIGTATVRIFGQSNSGRDLSATPFVNDWEGVTARTKNLPDGAVFTIRTRADIGVYR